MSVDSNTSTGLLVEQDGAVLTVTLNRPKLHNAQTPAMWRALARLGDEVDKQVRLVIVKGAGPSFSTGLELAMLKPSLDPAVETLAHVCAMDPVAASATIGEHQRAFTWLANGKMDGEWAGEAPGGAQRSRDTGCRPW